MLYYSQQPFEAEYRLFFNGLIFPNRAVIVKFRTVRNTLYYTVTITLIRNGVP